MGALGIIFKWWNDGPIRRYDHYIQHLGKSTIQKLQENYSNNFDVIICFMTRDFCLDVHIADSYLQGLKYRTEYSAVSYL